MAITRVGLTGAMTAYGTFAAKEAQSVVASTANWIVRCAMDDVLIESNSGDYVIQCPADDGVRES